MARKKAPEQELLDLSASLLDSHAQWKNLLEDGGHDPHYTDGFNMYLVRNHILYYKGEMERICKDHSLPLPDSYHIATPIEVDRSYMANPESIRENARACLAAFEADPSIRELAVILPSLRDGTAEKGERLLWNYTGLHNAIESDDLLSMRRNRDVHDILARTKSFRSNIRVRKRTL